MVPAIALTIAGSDPSGGAGIQADLKTFHQFGVYGEAVITLLTVQNTQRVTRVETVPDDFVAEQIEAVISDMPPAAAKTGALGSDEIVETVAKFARQFTFPLIVDPVMISKHGARLLSPDAELALKTRLLPYAYLVTPNIPEAESLAGFPIANEWDMQRAGEVILQTGCKAVLIKGGHAEGNPVDMLFDCAGLTRFPAERIDTRHTHGTGCSYSAALAACTALGYDLRTAAVISRGFIQQAIATAPGFGLGHGPINHFANLD